jgi:hypothetical protein
MLIRKTVAALTLAIATVAPCCAQSSYTIVDLGVCSPAAINRNGQVTGSKNFPGVQNVRAFLWIPASPSTFINLGTVKGYHYSVGTALNNRGDVAGYGGPIKSTGTANYPIFLPAGGAAVNVGSSGTTSGYAWGINDSQEIVGTSNGAFLSRIVNGKRKFFQIGTGGGFKINTSGQIGANVSNGYAYSGSYLWTPSGAVGQGTALTLPDGYATGALTDAGALAGARNFMIDVGNGPEQSTMPVVYFPGGPLGAASSWTDIPWPPAPAQGQWNNGQANGLNSSGVAVGSVSIWDAESSIAGPAWIWDSVNGTRDLNSLIPAGSGWVLTQAKGINDNGWIVGTGTVSGVTRGFVLIPN